LITFEKERKLRHCTLNSHLICIEEKDSNDTLVFFALHESKFIEVAEDSKNEFLNEQLENSLKTAEKIISRKINSFDINSGNNEEIVVHYIYTVGQIQYNLIATINAHKTSKGNMYMKIIDIENDLDFQHPVIESTRIYMCDS
jgi:hypothetical protein